MDIYFFRVINYISSIVFVIINITICRRPRTPRIIYFWCLAIPTRIIIPHRIIPTVGIQIQPISLVFILLQKPPYNWIIIPCPKIILPRYSIILLPGITDSIGNPFFLTNPASKGIILIIVLVLRLSFVIKAVLSCSF